MSEPTRETVVVQLERQEVEGLLAFSGGDPRAEDCNPDVCPTCRARGKLVVALASDSQRGEAEQPRCGRCGGRGEIERPAPHHGTEEDDWMSCPGCPDCQPEQGEDGDWPEVVVQRFKQDDPIRPHRYVVLDGTQSTDFTNCHRYVPAPTQPASTSDWTYDAIRMGRRQYAKRFIPDGPVEFFEDGEWKPYSIAAFQEREAAAGLLGVPADSAPTQPSIDRHSALVELFESLTPRDGSLGDLTAAAALAPHAWAEIQRLRSASTQPSISGEDRERLLKLADIIGAVHAPGADPRFHEDDARLLDRLASTLTRDPREEGTWPDSPSLASAPPEEARYSLEELGTVLTGDEMVRLRSAVASLPSAPPEVSGEEGFGEWLVGKARAHDSAAIDQPGRKVEHEGAARAFREAVARYEDHRPSPPEPSESPEVKRANAVLDAALAMAEERQCRHGFGRTTCAVCCSLPDAQVEHELHRGNSGPACDQCGPPEPSVQEGGWDDLRAVIDSACEGASKGNPPEDLAAYIWSNVGPRLAEERESANDLQARLEKVTKERNHATDAHVRHKAIEAAADIGQGKRRAEAERDRLDRGRENAKRVGAEWENRAKQAEKALEETVPVAKLQTLVEWHERRARISRANAEEPSRRAIMIDRAGGHELAAAVLSRVIEGKSVDL